MIIIVPSSVYCVSSLQLLPIFDWSFHCGNACHRSVLINANNNRCIVVIKASMKVVAPTRHRSTSSSILAVRKKSSCLIMKTRIDFRGEKLPVSEEMKECFRQLLDMLPEVPRNEEGNIDGTVLIQNVIDYILDLELQLDSTVDSSPTNYSPWKPKLPTDNCTREPLSEKSIDNTVSTQVPVRRLSFSDDSVLKRVDCDIRPPSQ